MEFPVELPEEWLQKAVNLKVFAEDVEEKFVRGSGSGGQKMNKTSSCVWLKHLPSGLEVKCQEFRERELNRLRAYKLLIGKMEDKKLGKASARAQKAFKMRKQKMRRNRKSKEKMLQAKAHRSDVKQSRSKPRF